MATSVTSVQLKRSKEVSVGQCNATAVTAASVSKGQLLKARVDRPGQRLQSAKMASSVSARQPHTRRVSSCRHCWDRPITAALVSLSQRDASRWRNPGQEAPSAWIEALVILGQSLRSSEIRSQCCASAITAVSVTWRQRLIRRRLRWGQCLVRAIRAVSVKLVHEDTTRDFKRGQRANRKRNAASDRLRQEERSRDSRREQRVAINSSTASVMRKQPLKLTLLAVWITSSSEKTSFSMMLLPKDIFDKQILRVFNHFTALASNSTVKLPFNARFINLRCKYFLLSLFTVAESRTAMSLSSRYGRI
mmetsp:Transcript_45157/g.78878  ORF Transcript_45157/g.78878 Transcript_45157/m.78878 type:complete len:306 (-) Transcript_45157:230-1147(-)